MHILKLMQIGSLTGEGEMFKGIGNNASIHQSISGNGNQMAGRNLNIEKSESKPVDELKKTD